MRHLLLILFLASLPPAIVHAEPFATYNPATGDVTFREVRNVGNVFVRSLSNAWSPDVMMAELMVEPTNAIPPLLSRRQDYLFLTGIPFEYTSVTVKRALLPGTPIGDLEYWNMYDPSSILKGSIFEIPEPGALLLAAMAPIAVALYRRRRRK